MDGKEGIMAEERGTFSSVKTIKMLSNDTLRSHPKFKSKMNHRRTGSTFKSSTITTMLSSYA